MAADVAVMSTTSSPPTAGPSAASAAPSMTPAQQLAAAAAAVAAAAPVGKPPTNSPLDLLGALASASLPLNVMHLAAAATNPAAMASLTAQHQALAAAAAAAAAAATPPPSNGGFSAPSASSVVQSATSGLTSLLGDNAQTRQLTTWIGDVTGVRAAPEHESDVEAQERDPLRAVAVNGGAPPDPAAGEQFSLSRSDRFKYFVAFLALSLVFFVSSLFFLPMVILMPGKFAFSFTCGSLSFMAAFALAQGPGAWLAGMVRWEKLPFTLAYGVSIVGTLYCTLVWRSYIGAVVFGSLQVSVLAWYASNNIPGGRTGLRVLVASLKAAFVGCFKACRACVGLIV